VAERPEDNGSPQLFHAFTFYGNTLSRVKLFSFGATTYL
jgi:hypothetical protein